MLPEEWLGGSHSVYSQDMSLSFCVECSCHAVHTIAYGVCSLTNRSLFNLLFVARYVEENDASNLTAHFRSLNLLSCAKARVALTDTFFIET